MVGFRDCSRGCTASHRSSARYGVYGWFQVLIRAPRLSPDNKISLVSLSTGGLWAKVTIIIVTLAQTRRNMAQVNWPAEVATKRTTLLTHDAPCAG
eukprot:g31359.t1